MAPFAISFVSLYGCTCLFRNLKHRAGYSTVSANAMVSGIHALAMVVAGIAIFSSLKSDTWRFGDTTPPTIGAVLSASLGYFVYDFVCCSWMDYERGNLNAAILAHHVFAIAGTAAAVFAKRSGIEVFMSIFFAELSTPFLHARTLLKERFRAETRLLKMVEGLFALSFTVFRVLICPFLTYHTAIAAQGPLLVKVCGVALQAISFYWFALIVQLTKRTLTSSRTQQK